MKSAWLIDEFKKRKYVITNSDLDGILSASLLIYFFPTLEIGGFTNSSDKVWINNKVTSDNSIYLDIYMTNPKVLSIDNHIVDFIDNVYSAYKVNPNIMLKKSLKNYSNKYPFSTFIFLVKLLEENGYYLSIDINKTCGYAVKENIYLWELMLRADDTLCNTFLYEKNSHYWWGWMLNGTKENSILRQLYLKIKCDVQNIKNAKLIKDKVQTYFYKTFFIKHDGYKSIQNNNFDDFFRSISINITNINCLKKDFKVITLKTRRLELDGKFNNLEEIALNYNIKTLAFVNKNVLSFSFI